MNHPLANSASDPDLDTESGSGYGHGGGGGQERRPLLEKVRSKVEDVKQVMAQNIDKMLDRGERFASLESKTVALQENSNMFQKATRSIRNQALLADVRVKIIAGLILAIVIVLIWILVRATRH